MEDCDTCTSADSCDECSGSMFFDSEAGACVQVPARPASSAALRLLLSLPACNRSPAACLPACPARCHLQCAPGCKTCTSLDQCSECEYAHTNATADGSPCTPCADEECEDCAAEGPEVCAECSTGFGPDPDTRRCTACTVASCVECARLSTNCTECADGFVLDAASGACTPVSGRQAPAVQHGHELHATCVQCAVLLAC